MAIKIDWSKYEGVGNNPVKQQSSISNTINDVLDNDTLNKAKGYVGQAGNSFLLYQAPHIVGAIKEYANLRKNVNNLDYKKAFKEFGKSYKEGRENTKKELNEFRQENPKSSFVAELAGGIGSGGAVSTLGKAAIKRAIPRAIAEGGLYGGLAGASNTEGKGFDPLGATIGTIAGGAGGAALGTLGKLARRLFLSKNTGRVGDYIRPEGTQEHSMQHILNDKEVADVVSKGGVGKRMAEFTGEAQKSFDNARATIDNAIKQAYEGIDEKTLINLDKKGMKNFISKVEKNVGSDRESQKILNGAKLILKDIKGNNVELGRIKNLKDRIYRLKNSAYTTDAKTGDTKRLVSQETIDMLDNMYNSLANAEKNHSPQLKYANEFYSDMKNLNEEVSKINPKGLYGEDKLARAATKQNKDVSGNIFAEAESNIRKILNKYPQVKNIDKFLTDLKKVQVSSNIKPDENYATSFTIRKIIDHFIKGGSRDQRMQMFAKAVKDGKITKDMLNQEFTKARNIPILTDIVNYHLAASKAPGVNNLSKIINKTPAFAQFALPRATMRYILDKYYNKEQ